MNKVTVLFLMFVLTAGLFAGGDDESVSTGSDEAYEFTIFAPWTPETTEVDKAFFRGLEEALDLKINLEIPPSANFRERQQVMLATGEYPELVFFSSATDKMFVDAVNNGLVLPVNEYLENAPNIVKYSYQASMDYLKVKGDEQIFGIPRTSVTRADGFSVRADWLENLGIDYAKDGEPVTLEEFTEMHRAFALMDPDGNGVNDTYGMGLQVDTNGNMGVPKHIQWAFDLHGWQEYDGEYLDLKYSRNHDNFKRALAYMNMLWEEKLLDPDWPTLGGDTALDRWRTGKYYGIYSGFAGWLIAFEKGQQEFVPEAKLIYATGIENEKGVTQGGTDSTGTWGLWAVMADAEQPERIVEMLDYALSDNYWDTVNFGPEGLTWNNEDGLKVPTDLYKDHNYGRKFVRRSNDAEFFVTLDMSNENRNRLNNLISICIDQAIFYKSKGYRPSVSDSQSFLDARTELNRMISKIIVGQEPVSAWDAALDRWYANGGGDYVEEMQAYIRSQN